MAELSAAPLHIGEPALLSDGAIATLKWLALLCMTCDHVDVLLFEARLGLAATVGRLALPLFVFVLAHNLVARPLRPGMHARALVRMLISGALAVPLLAAMGRGWSPLNIMFSLALCVACAWAAQAIASSRRGDLVRACLAAGALQLAALAALLVDYQWWALGLFAACCLWSARPGWCAGMAMVLALGALVHRHHSAWPLLAMPIIVVAGQSRLQLASDKVPRYGTFFYAYYPGHLAVLCGLQLLQRS